MKASEAADLLGVSEATVSRICSGERRPSIDLMFKIRAVLVWSVEAQVDSVRVGTYAQEFRQKMERRRARTRS